jgi:hypothetical protein
MRVGSLVKNYTRIGVIVETDYDRSRFNHTALKVVWTSGDWGWFCEMSLEVV